VPEVVGGSGVRPARAAAARLASALRSQASPGLARAVRPSRLLPLGAALTAQGAVDARRAGPSRVTLLVYLRRIAVGGTVSTRMRGRDDRRDRRRRGLGSAGPRPDGDGWVRRPSERCRRSLQSPSRVGAAPGSDGLPPVDPGQHCFPLCARCLSGSNHPYGGGTKAAEPPRTPRRPRQLGVERSLCVLQQRLGCSDRHPLFTAQRGKRFR